MDMPQMSLGLLARIAHFAVVVVPLSLIYLMHFRVMHHPNRPLAAEQVRLARQIHHGLLLALALAWVTGFLSTYAAFRVAQVDVLTYFSNPKLQAKILDVFVLSVNAASLHYIFMPRLKVGYVFFKDKLWFLCLCILLGSVSTTSWFTAYLLGLSRQEWSYRYPLSTFITLWGAGVVLVGILGAIHLYRHYQLATTEGEWTETRVMS